MLNQNPEPSDWLIRLIEKCFYFSAYIATRTHQLAGFKTKGPLMEGLASMGYFGKLDHLRVARQADEVFTFDELANITGINRLTDLYRQKAQNPQILFHKPTTNGSEVVITCKYLPPEKSHSFFQERMNLPKSQPGLQFRIAVNLQNKIYPQEAFLDLREIDKDVFTIDSGVYGNGCLTNFLKSTYGTDKKRNYLSLIGRRHDLVSDARVVEGKPLLQ